MFSIQKSHLGNYGLSGAGVVYQHIFPDKDHIDLYLLNKCAKIYRIMCKTTDFHLESYICVVTFKNY